MASIHVLEKARFRAERRGSRQTTELQRPLNFEELSKIPVPPENFIPGALAYLQLGRAYIIQADTVKAKAACQDFLPLWRDADPDIPILKQAKAEYAKLQ